MTPRNEATDELAGKLIAYLRDALNDSTLEYDSPLTQLQGGYETSMYQFQLKGLQQELNQRLVLRLYPEYRGAEAAFLESVIQNALAKEGHPVAKAYSLCTDKSILGGVFFIMDFLPGEPMIAASMETIPGLLGKTHAALHGIDPQFLVNSLTEQGISEYVYGFGSRLDMLRNDATELPWIGDGVGWLVENRPPEPGRLALCHGDFHPLNILIQDGAVTGVLDWPGFLVADPALDIANTTWLMTVAFPRLASSGLAPGFASVDFEMVSRQYLDAYRDQLPLDSTNVDYYKVFRSVRALIEGFRGQEVWLTPSIVRAVIEFIDKVTGIRITMPD